MVLPVDQQEEPVLDGNQVMNRCLLQQQQHQQHPWGEDGEDVKWKPPWTGVLDNGGAVNTRWIRLRLTQVVLRYALPVSAPKVNCRTQGTKLGIFLKSQVAPSLKRKLGTHTII